LISLIKLFVQSGPNLQRKKQQRVDSLPDRSITLCTEINPNWAHFWVILGKSHKKYSHLSVIWTCSRFILVLLRSRGE